MDQKEIRNDEERKTQEWAVKYPKEWEIVCGVRIVDAQYNMRILNMLREAGLDELKEMISCRIYQMVSAEEKKYFTQE